MADVNKKRTRIWILLKRLYLISNDDKNYSNLSGDELRDLYVEEEFTPEEVLVALRRTFNIEDNLIIKLRNHRGSLVPVNAHLQANSKAYPYVLEVVKKYQNVALGSKSVTGTEYTEALHVAFNAMISRIAHLEAELPNLKNRRKEKLDDDLLDVSNRLDFLNSRLGTAEESTWQGMFKKCPLW